MSKVVETRIRLNVDAQGGEQATATIGSAAQAADKAQQAFRNAEAASSDLYSSIIDASPDAQRQVEALTETYGRLRQEMARLPDTMKTAVDSVLQRLERADLLGAANATATPAYARLPENAQQHLGALFQQVNDLSRMGMGVDFDRLAADSSPATPGSPAPGDFNRGRYKRLSNRYESRLDTFETVLDGAETDLDNLTPYHVRSLRSRMGQIGSIGRQAREAAGPDQEPQLGALDERLAAYGGRLDDLLRQRAERGHRDDPVEDAADPNFEGTFAKRLLALEADMVGPSADPLTLSRRLSRAQGDLGANSGNLDEQTLRQFGDALKQNSERLQEIITPWRADNTRSFAPGFGRNLSGLERQIDDLAPDSSRHSLIDLRGRVERAGRTLEGQDGALEPEVFESLTESVKRLTAKMDENVQAYNDRERGQAIDPSQPQTQDNGPNPLGDFMENLMGRMPQGGLLGRLLPGAAVVGAGFQLANMADRFVVGQNRAARDEYGAMTDLTRQLGIHQDPWTLFRNRTNGLSREELYEYGYNATDAGRVAAGLDLPAGARDTRDTVMDILRLSRSTGLDESQVTGAVRQMGLAGGVTPGDSQEPLETIKLALTEAVKNGVSQADTLNALVGISQQALAQGREMKPAEMAYQAALQATLADLGTKTLQGAAGAANQQGVIGAVTGAGDPALAAYLAPALQGFGAADLGLEPDSAAALALADLESVSPYAAAQEKLRLAADGGSPEVMKGLAQRLEGATGGRPDLLLKILEQYGVTGEAALTIVGNGLSQTVSTAAGRTGEFAAGRNLDGGAQQNNRTAQEGFTIAATRPDLPVADSWGDIALNNAADVTTTQGKKTATAAKTTLETFLGTGDDGNSAQALAELSAADFLAVTAGKSPAEIERMTRLRNEYLGKNGGEPAGGGWFDQQLQKFNDFTSPSRWLNLRRRPEAHPPAAAAGGAAPRRPRVSAEQGFGLMGATLLTNAPGETYEGLTGSAAHLNGQQHRGVDLRIGEAGRPDTIRNPWEGVEIIDAGQSDTYGNWMSVQAPDGSKWQMGHLHDDMSHRVGSRVPKGGYLATEGNTGASTGYHLDFRALEETPELEALNKDPEAYYRAFDKSLNAGRGPVEPQRVDVYVHGLEQIEVRGVQGQAAQQVNEAVSSIVTAVSTPSSHAGPR